MAALEDKINNWCQEESLSVTADRDDQATFASTVSLPGEPPATVSVRSPASQPGKLLLNHAFEPAAGPDVARRPDGAERIATFLKGVSAGRSGLAECYLAEGKQAPTAEVSITLHEDGISKHGFLSALEDIRKIHSIVEWGLEAMRVVEGKMEDFEAMAKEGEAASTGSGRTIGEFEVPAVAAGPEPPPAPTAAPAGRFCLNCGKRAKPDQGFCIGCGTKLEGPG